MFPSSLCQLFPWCHVFLSSLYTNQIFEIFSNPQIFCSSILSLFLHTCTLYYIKKNKNMEVIYNLDWLYSPLLICYLIFTIWYGISKSYKARCSNRKNTPEELLCKIHTNLDTNVFAKRYICQFKSKKLENLNYCS